MNRSLWTKDLTQKSCPPWPCPTCGSGTIALEAKTLVCEETVESARNHDHDAWEPEWIEYLFTVWGRCTHPSCLQGFAIAGKGGVEPDYHDRGGLQFNDFFRPMTCTPMPQIINLPPKCPKLVADSLRDSFSLFWSSPAACAGAMRRSVEYLMDHVGVPRTVTAKNGDLSDLTLHARINLYAATDQTIGPHLMALKWLGNAGAHAGQVNHDELLDAFEILEYALAEVVEQRSARVAALATKLTQNHGK